LIYRQVDAARILASLQGDYKQNFYSDLDIINLVIDSDEIQNKINSSGIILGDASGISVENGFFGFDVKRYNLFQSLYQETLRYIFKTKKNGFVPFISFFDKLIKEEDIELEEIIFKYEFS